MAASDAAPGLVNLSGLMDDAKCFAFVRRRRWPEGVRCPGCDSAAVIRHGCDDTQPHRQRYCCKGVVRNRVTREAGLALPGWVMAPSGFHRRGEYGPRCWRGGQATA